MREYLEVIWKVDAGRGVLAHGLPPCLQAVKQIVAALHLLPRAGPELGLGRWSGFGDMCLVWKGYGYG